MVFKHLREEARLILVFLINKDPVFCSLLFSGASFEPDLGGYHLQDKS